MEVVSCSSDGPSPIDGSTAVATVPAHAVSVVNSNANITVNGSSSGGGSATPKLELAATQHDPYERQTVLMWGSQSSGIPINSIGGVAGGSSRRHHSNAERSPQTTPLTNGLSYTNNNNNNNENDVVTAKWNGNARTKDIKNAATPDSYQLQHDDSGLYSSSSHTTSPQQQQQVAPTNQQQSTQRPSVGNSVADQQISNSTAAHLVHAHTQQQQQQHLHVHMQHANAPPLPHSSSSSTSANTLPLQTHTAASNAVGPAPTTTAAIASAAAAAAATAAALASSSASSTTATATSTHFNFSTHYEGLTAEMANYVSDLVGGKENGAFIQSLPGAMGHLMTSPWLAATLNWVGLVVEPEPRRFFTLRKQNAQRPGLQVVHACISPNPYPKEVRVLWLWHSFIYCKN